ncbi:MAG: LamB/YcsF family protein [Syntrophorhabdaceae bacterium]|nr:LamB/YcsF family protein [Syntrophorhabdaceae bacterium]
MVNVVDINCDMGESFGDYKIGNDEKVVPYITSANIACGFHASDPNVIDRTVKLCKSNNVMCGAHPGYPDLMGFGRRFMDVAEAELINYIVYQVGAVKGFTDLYGVRLQHVKLHGALYNYMVNQEELFLKIIDALRKAFGDIIFLTLGTGKTVEFKKRCSGLGIKLGLEAFPDRNYTDEGELLPRKYKDAVLHDNELIATRAVQMVKEQGIRSINGRWIDMNIDTLCIHGDNEESIEAAKKIRDYIIKEGIEVRPLSGFIK